MAVSPLGSGRLLPGGGVGKLGRRVEVFFSSKEGGVEIFSQITRGGVEIFLAQKSTLFLPVCKIFSGGGPPYHHQLYLYPLIYMYSLCSQYIL